MKVPGQDPDKTEVARIVDFRLQAIKIWVVVIIAQHVQGVSPDHFRFNRPALGIFREPTGIPG